MPRGYHPDIDPEGRLIGALVALLPAIGEPTIAVDNGELDELGNPVLTTYPNPEFVSSKQATLNAIADAAGTAGVVVYEMLFSGDAPLGKGRVACQIYVVSATASQAERDAVDATRTTLDTVFAQFS